MRRARVTLLVGLLAACSNQPPQQPSMPGQLIGSFAFTGTLVDSDGGVDGGTTCLLDGGPLVFSSTITFYAYLSQDAEAGVIWWGLNGGAGVIDGGLDGSTFWVAVPSSTPALGTPCNCVGTILESIQGWQVLPGGIQPEGGFELPVSQIAGRLDDRLAPDYSSSPVCSEEAGPGCGLNCDLVYDFVGVPGTAP